MDRKALPVPDQSRPELESEYIEPRTDNEKKLAAICAELLNLDKVGIYDSFFGIAITGHLWETNDRWISRRNRAKKNYGRNPATSTDY